MDWFLYAKDLRHGRVKQHLSNILGLMHEKVNQHWGRFEKVVDYKKSLYTFANVFF